MLRTQVRSVNVAILATTAVRGVVVPVPSPNLDRGLRMKREGGQGHALQEEGHIQDQGLAVQEEVVVAGLKIVGLTIVTLTMASGFTLLIWIAKQARGTWKNCLANMAL